MKLMGKPFVTLNGYCAEILLVGTAQMVLSM